MARMNDVEVLFPNEVYTRNLSTHTKVSVEQVGEFGRYVEATNSIRGSRHYLIRHLSATADYSTKYPRATVEVKVEFVDNLDTGELVVTFEHEDYGDSNMSVTSSWTMRGKDQRAIWEEAYHYLTNVPCMALV